MHKVTKSQVGLKQLTCAWEVEMYGVSVLVDDVRPWNLSIS